MTEFRDEFVDQIKTGAEALEDAGYDVIRYQGEIVSDPKTINGIGETPEEALENTLSELKSHGELFLPVDNDEFYDVIQGEQNPEQLIYRNLRGVIEPDEPLVESEWSDDTRPAFGTFVHYISGPEDYWEVTTMETLDPYTVEDAEERAEDIVATLEEYGLDAEVGTIR